MWPPHEEITDAQRAEPVLAGRGAGRCNPRGTAAVPSGPRVRVRGRREAQREAEESAVAGPLPGSFCNGQFSPNEPFRNRLRVRAPPSASAAGLTTSMGVGALGAGAGKGLMGRGRLGWAHSR